MGMLVYNADAFMALPTELKFLLVILLIVSIVYGIIKKLWRVVEIGVIFAAIYYVMTKVGLL